MPGRSRRSASKNRSKNRSKKVHSKLKTRSGRYKGAGTQDDKAKRYDSIVSLLNAVDQEAIFSKLYIDIKAIVDEPSELEVLRELQQNELLQIQTDREAARKTANTRLQSSIEETIGDRKMDYHVLKEIVGEFPTLTSSSTKEQIIQVIMQMHEWVYRLPSYLEYIGRLEIGRDVPPPDSYYAKLVNLYRIFGVPEEDVKEKIELVSHMSIPA